MQKNGVPMMNKNGMGVRGILTIKEFSKETGELLDQYTDENVVTEQGINTLFLRMALNDPDSNMRFDHFTLGVDYGIEEDAAGGWGMLNPKPAEKRYTSLNQYSVYSVPYGDMVFDYPESNTFQAATLLDGKYILDTFYPEDVDMRYTSATFRFVNNTTFSYKRFPVRSLSRLIDVQIIWTFKFVNEYDYLCPVPPYEAQLRFYGAESTLRYYMDGSGDDQGSMLRTDVTGQHNTRLVKAQPNGDVIVIKDDKRLVRMTENGTIEIDRDINVTDPIIALDSDVNNISYVGTDNTNGTVAKLDANGDVIWTVSLSAIDGRSKRVNEIWAINNSRIGIVTRDDSNFTPGVSGNMIHVISATDGMIIYATTLENNQGTTGYLDFISSSGGEFFAIQREAAAGDSNSLIKLAYDLSEIERIDLSGTVKSIYAAHENDVLVGYNNGSGSTVARYDADLNYIWRYDGSGSGYEHLGVDRIGNIYAATANRIDVFNPSLDLISTGTFSGALDMSVVGRKWSYFS